MDTVETPAERQTRRLAWLRRLGENTMVLADAEAAAALAEVEHPPEPKPLPARAPRPRDHFKAFLAASSAIRQLIALELRVEAGPPASRQKAPAYRIPPPPDPRRPLLQEVLHDAVRNAPDRARRRRDIDACIEEELLADPGGAKRLATITVDICTKLHIDVDIARVPDAFLDYDEPIKTLSKPKTREPH